MSRLPSSNRTPQNPIHNEQGAALVIALLAVVMMTIIGLVMLNVVRNGFINSASSEAEIQADMLAQKGLDEALALIKNAVKEGNASTLNYRSKVANVETNLNENIDRADGTSNDGIYSVETSVGDYKVDFSLDTSLDAASRTQVIRNPNDLGVVVPFPDDPYVHQVIVTSTGHTGNGRPNRTVTKRMKVYVSSIQPVFRYPLSAAGNLKLQGATAITGDVLARIPSGCPAPCGDIRVGNVASFVKGPGTSYTISSDLPSIRGFIRAQGSYYLNNTLTPFAPTLFSGSYKPFEDRNLTPDQDIDVEAYVGKQVDDIRLGQLSATATETMDAEQFGGYKAGASNGQPTIPVSRLYDEQWLDVTGDLQVNGNLILNEGVLTINKVSDTQATHVTMQNGSIYVKTPDPHLVAADLTGSVNLVNRSASMAVEGNTTLTNFTLNGNLFVHGDLKIIGNLNVTNGSIFVDGNVELKEMTSINQGTDRPVILAASRRIIMSDNQSSTQVRAFLYSRLEDLSLYGVLSKLEIRGGIHGKNVELNAVKGDASKTSMAGTVAHPSSGYFFSANQTSLPEDRSRLKVIYDNSLYTNPPIGIPITPNISVYVKEITYQ
ncbi:hypothetical protein [Gorillibacterium sp. sgz5001074]|uniref:hypothetical protein n=1 Tax=Gorillibacterium sp. sgz5001074 TaxID=3446695 RepID=UPI003F679A75